MKPQKIMLFENEKNQEVRDVFLKIYREMDVSDLNQAFNQTEEYFSESMHYPDVVLSLANLAITFSIISPELHGKAVDAIELELKPTIGWKQPVERKNFLIGFKTYLDVAVPANKKRVNPIIYEDVE